MFKNPLPAVVITVLALVAAPLLLALIDTDMSGLTWITSGVVVTVWLALGLAGAVAMVVLGVLSMRDAQVHEADPRAQQVIDSVAANSKAAKAAKAAKAEERAQRSPRSKPRSAPAA